MPFVEPGRPSDLIEETHRLFRDTYGGEATAIARAPGRVNLIGEHTDYNGGLVLPVALPHATYAAVAARDDRVLRIASGDDGEPWTGSIDEVGPGAVDGWAAYVGGVLWALREDGIELPGMDVVVHGTVPLGAGLSSSAALECSVALAACGLVGLPVDDALRHRLVAACIRAETEVAGAPTGGMDQSISLLAVAEAALLIDFGDDTSQPVPLHLPEAGLTLLVTDTRVEHALVDGGYAARRADCEAAAAALGVRTLREATLDSVAGIEDERVRRRATHIVTEIARVRDVVAAVSTADWAAVGRAFGASHASMRDDFEISCPELDLTVVTAVEAGAVGARMTGGGFGGSAVSLVPTERVDAVVRAVDTAFAAAGFRPPQHLVAEPSRAAAVVD
ncbi:galactokinase [Nocardioides sp. Root1257]|uniref:galactokinase n=1 Tax=unclassified Nocardioides TaxID=2615069 RepID=UPI0006F4405C|nr:MULTISPECIES: galactokinase [unclassified Nocardioides]KQW52888.1 galactokinase [Nocardioides sp. Root1257]KRC55576.1 galactokinase [Nocardioides sp. Root224]